MVYFLVGIAGIIGASLRYLMGLPFKDTLVHGFPIATFLINMIGCFILGGFTTFLPKLKFLSPSFVTALATGLVGSFTTFSTFSVETVQLMIESKWGIAVIYILLSLWGGLLFSLLGYRAGMLYKRDGGMEESC